MATPNMMTATTMTPTVLVSTQVHPTAETAIYTVAANKAVKIAHGVISNVGGADATIGLSIVPSGGSLDATHKVIPDSFSLAAGDSLSLSDLLGGAMLGDGDKIAVKAGTADVIDVVITGVVIA